MDEAVKSKNPLRRVLGNKRWQFITIPLFSILCSLVAISIVILLIGKNPLTAFTSLLQGSGWIGKTNYAAGKGQITDFMEFLDALTPMLFAALAVAVAFKAGLFNIGVSGQMLLSGFVTSVLVGYSDLPGAVAKPLVLLCGMLVGSLAGALIGLLKYRFNINEVVSAIMLNYIFQYIISYFINTPQFLDPVYRQSKTVSSAARLTLIDLTVGNYKMRVPWVILLALACAVALWAFLAKTRQGYEVKAVGLNPLAANYAGIRVGGNIVLAMVLSGGLAGLAGVTYYLGYFNAIIPNQLANLGFDSIATALLGNAHPLGIIASSILITTLDKGSIYMSSTVGVRQEITSLITGLILLFSACSMYIRYLVNRSPKQKKGGAPGPTQAAKGGDKA